MANPSVRGYQSQNLNVLKEGMKMFVKNVAQPQLVSILRQKAQEVVQLIDSGLIPEYTANLHDATGCAVYADGAISAFIPTKRAQKQGKSGFDGVNHYGIDGSAFLQQAISEASTRFAKGVWFVVFSAVPYAYHINAKGSPLGRGQNFFDRIANTTVNEILAGLRPIAESVTATPTML
jgi:hypothetical protein